MCQLFAISSTEPLDTNPLLREFFSHGDENPHGWGVADLSSRGIVLTRSAERADKSPQAQQFLSRSHRYSNMIAHIRAATIGQVEVENNHPFSNVDSSGRRWTLMHKGTIFNYEPLNPYFYVQQGATDSERILLYLIDRINRKIVEKGAPLEADERFAVFSNLVWEMSKGNCLNLVVFDSDQFYIHVNYQGALSVLSEKDSIIFCTSQLDAAQSILKTNAEWLPLALCTPFVCKRGRFVTSGKSHDFEYFDDEKDTRYLNLDYASL